MSNPPDVALFYRQPRADGNFSIESSFDAMLSEISADSGVQIRKVVSSFLSNGTLPRVRAIFEAREHAGDVNHVTGDTHYLVFGLAGERTILTIHDCSMVDGATGLRRKLLKLLWIDLPVRHCAIVTTVSEATRARVIELSGCDPAKVHVIPTIVSDRFTHSPFEFNSARPRILHLGTAWNKNLDRHIEALRGIDCVLHIVGRIGDGHKRLLAENNIAFENEHGVSDQRLEEIYAQCDMLLFSSLMEGFGMPIIEAQRVGRPVITSNLSSMPEVAGQGACLVDPKSVASIRAGIEKVCSDVPWREQLISAGTANAKRYAAAEVAAQYAALYRSLQEKS